MLDVYKFVWGVKNGRVVTASALNRGGNSLRT